MCGRRDAGFCMPCAYPGCATAWHPLCGRRGGLRMELAAEPGSADGGGVLRGFCEAHRGATDAEIAAGPQSLAAGPQSELQAPAAGPSSDAAAAAATAALPPPPPVLVSEHSGLGISLASPPLPRPPQLGAGGLTRQNSALSDLQ